MEPVYADRELHDLMEKLVALPKETEWVEFKCNNNDPEEIGKRLSAVANGACLHRQANGYLVFGVEDGTHRMVGTDFRPKSARKGGEELEHWLATLRACYQHACLKYVSNEQMTNQSLRERFKIEDHNYSIASRIIADTIDAGLVKSYDPENLSKKHARYIPIWA